MKCIDHYLLKKRQKFCYSCSPFVLFHNGVQKPCTVFTAACVRKERKWMKCAPP